MSALEDLLRRIDDAIDATGDSAHDRVAGWVKVPTERTGPAVVRTVLEQPLPDVDVCRYCRGTGRRTFAGESPHWCRECNGIGYVEQQQLDAQLTPAQHCPTCSHIPHGTGPCSVADCACYAGQRCPCGHATACSDPAHCVVP